VGQNILGFDIYVHNVLRQLCGKPTDYSYIPRVIDTKALSMAKNASVAYNGDSRILWQYRVMTITKGKGKNSQLSLLKSLDIPFDENKLHNSLYDVTMTWEIFKKLIWSIEVP
jgi:DNA polymerase III epsilon subunit-like protein